MNITKCLNTSCVFIGTFIGAGFATGREILLFFGKSSPAVPILSALICGLFCSLFLYAGHKGLNVIPTKGGRLMLFGFSLAAFIIYSAMISASEEIIYALTSLHGGGVFLVIVIGIICLSNREGLKMLNVIVVPLIIILIIYMGVKVENIIMPIKLNIYNAVAYASLNMFLGGFLVVHDGRSMTSREIVVSGILSAVILSISIFIIYRIVLTAELATMPVMDVAISLNLSIIASLIILLAIISTMAGCFTALTAISTVLFKNKWLVGSFIALKGVMTAILGFRMIVDVGYPIVSIVGIIYTVGVIVAILKGNNCNRVELLGSGETI